MELKLISIMKYEGGQRILPTYVLNFFLPNFADISACINYVLPGDENEHNDGYFSDIELYYLTVEGIEQLYPMATKKEESIMNYDEEIMKKHNYKLTTYSFL